MHMFDAATAGNILARNRGKLEQIPTDQGLSAAGIIRLAIAFAAVALLVVALDRAAGSPAPAVSGVSAAACQLLPTCID
jgi:hypothetical protein